MMEKSVLIRQGTVSDMPAVFELIMELARYELAPNEVTNTLQQLTEDGFGKRPLFECLVAVLNGRVIGFALAYVSYSTWKGKCLYLEDFIVTAEFRRKGVGVLLFKELHQVAIKGNYKRFHWQVLDWNVPAIEFYKKYNAELDETWINCRLVLTP